MITIKVVTCEGQPPLGQALAADFDELGGTIGRGEQSTLTLPDPLRHISRVHAKILFRAGRYLIQDHGTAVPVQVNGRAIGEGGEAELADNDEIVIGAYTLRVTVQARPAATQPASASGAAAKDDPLALFGAGSPTSDPFADLLAPNPSPTPAASPASRIDEPLSPPPRPATPPPPRDIIPPDFDPFAEPVPPAKPTPQLGDVDLSPATGPESIDQLFGLDNGTPPDLGGLEGPFAAAGAAKQGEPDLGRPQRDDTPEMYGAFKLPTAKGTEAASPGGTGEDMVLSWDERQAKAGEPGQIKTMIVGSRQGHGESTKPKRAEGAPVKPAATPAPTQPAEAAAERAPARPATAQASPPPQSREAGSQEDALRAFLAGAGVPGLNLPGGLSPQTMEVLGKVFREAMQGTLDLLLARATLKREIRADLTMIVPRENNPLKFSPNVEAALTHLLGPPTRGFMAPLDAMKDAYDDLRAHQFGFMAGMRAALDGVLRRFEPSVLEQRLTGKTMLDSLLPMNRKAKLWDMFTELYGDISKEAEDDFHALFGREFLRAYEEQIAQLESEGKRSKV
jgi:FHA domain-containing protein